MLISCAPLDLRSNWALPPPRALLTPLPCLQGERGTRTASAEAATMCLLFSLSRRTFYRIAAHYPEVADSLNIVAAARAAVNSNQSVNAEELLRIKVRVQARV